MKHHLDVLQPGQALIDGEIDRPLPAPYVVVRDDRRSIMARDLQDELVLITVDGSVTDALKRQGSHLPLEDVTDIKTNLNNLLKVASDEKLVAHPVDVDGLDITYLFCSEHPNGPSSIKAATTVNFSPEEINQAVTQRNEQLGLIESHAPSQNTNYQHSPQAEVKPK